MAMKERSENANLGNLTSEHIFCKSTFNYKGTNKLNAMNSGTIILMNTL